MFLSNNVCYCFCFLDLIYISDKTGSTKIVNGMIRPSESLSGMENLPRDPREGIVQMKNKIRSAQFVSCTTLMSMLPNAVMQIYVLNASCRYGHKRKNFLAVHFAAAKS